MDDRTGGCRSSSTRFTWIPNHGVDIDAYYVLFFISGIPALTYQIVWQRALFTLYGVNIESVIVIVTAFKAKVWSRETNCGGA